MLERIRALYCRSRPEELLVHEVRALEDRVPEINENLSMLKAQVTVLEKDLAKTRGRAGTLEDKIRDAEAFGRRDMALNYAESMEAVRAEQHRIEEELPLAREAFALGQRLKAEFMDHKERAIDRAREALSAKRRTEWNRRATEALRVFEKRSSDPGLELLARRLLAEADESDAELRELLGRLAG